MIKISVIVPVYNVVNELELCIQSIKNQTYKNLEIILIDDGSNDGSGELCDALSKTDERIKVIHQENQGPAAARKVGFQLSSGGVLSFVDSDDYLESGMYMEMINCLYTYNADIVFCDYNSIKDGNVNKEVFYSSDMKMDNMKALKFLAEDKIKSFMCNKLYRKEVLQIDDFHVGKIMEDLLCMHNIIYRCKRIVYKKGGFYNYVRRNSSIMGAKKSFYFYWSAWQERLEWYKKHCSEYSGLCLNRVVRVSLTCFEERILSEEESRAVKSFLKLNLKNILRNKQLNLHKKAKVLFYLR